MTKKLKIQSNKKEDNYGTPKKAVDLIIPYLNKKWAIWECAWGEGNLFKHLSDSGFKVYGSKDIDFLNTASEDKLFDCIVTNPPYSLKEEFLEQCYNYHVPFALLMPLTALEGIKRGKMFKEHGIQLIIPNRRINFITPSGKGGGSWFPTAWFCYGLNLPKDINFVELEKDE